MNSKSPLAIEGAGLRVQFALAGDRYAHRIAVADGAGWSVMLESVEGTADEPWPASPPLQSLHVEQREEGRQLALLVGMAGKSHWSLSVDLDPARRRLTFDAACRVTKGDTGPLGSRYRLVGASEPGREGGDAIVLARIAGRGVRFEVLDSPGPAQYRLEGRLLSVAPTPNEQAPPHTVRGAMP